MEVYSLSQEGEKERIHTVHRLSAYSDKGASHVLIFCKLLAGLGVVLRNLLRELASYIFILHCTKVIKAIADDQSADTKLNNTAGIFVRA